MIQVRTADSRGHAHFGWLDSRHTFSFGSYHDPQHMGVSALRVINDDRVEPGAGFSAHPHRDMEIISYVLEGTIEHKDSLGSHSQLKAGELQVMSAGTGIVHSEYNPSQDEGLHFLQIWIQPDTRGVAPRYEQHDISALRGLQLVVSPDGQGGSLRIHQDARVWLVRFDGAPLGFAPVAGRSYYLQVARGEVTVNGVTLAVGDGATITAEAELQLSGAAGAEALLFDLP